MNIQQLRTAIEKSQSYAKAPVFKQSLMLKKKNVEHLHDLYGQASRLGLDYLAQNQNITLSDFGLIKELINEVHTGTVGEV